MRTVDIYAVLSRHHSIIVGGSNGTLPIFKYNLKVARGKKGDGICKWHGKSSDTGGVEKPPLF
jgi:hypothetical protein